MPRVLAKYRKVADGQLDEAFASVLGSMCLPGSPGLISLDRLVQATQVSGGGKWAKYTFTGEI